MQNPESALENETYKFLWDFEILTNPLISARRPDLEIVNKKKKNLQNWTLPFQLTTEKESEKRDKYLDFGRELKKRWTKKVTVIPIVIGALGTSHQTIDKGLENLETRGQVETIQMTALLISTRILRRVLET